MKKEGKKASVSLEETHMRTDQTYWSYLGVCRVPYYTVILKTLLS